MKRSSLLLVLGLVGVAGLGLAISKVVGPRNSCGSGCESSPAATALAPANPVARAPVQLEALVPAQAAAAGVVKLQLEQAAAPQRTDAAPQASVALQAAQNAPRLLTSAEFVRHGSTDLPSLLRLRAIQQHTQPAGPGMRNQGLALARLTPEELHASQDPAVAARQMREGRMGTNAAAAANPKLFKKQPIQAVSPK